LISLLASLAIAQSQVDDPLLLIGEYPTPGPMRTPTVTALQSDGQVEVSFAVNIGVVDITVKDARNVVVYQVVIDTDITSDVVIDTAAWPSGDYLLVITWAKNKQLTGEFTL